MWTLGADIIIITLATWRENPTTVELDRPLTSSIVRPCIEPGLVDTSVGDHMFSLSPSHFVGVVSDHDPLTHRRTRLTADGIRRLELDHGPDVVIIVVRRDGGGRRASTRLGRGGHVGHLGRLHPSSAGQRRPRPSPAAAVDPAAFPAPTAASAASPSKRPSPPTPHVTNVHH